MQLLIATRNRHKTREFAQLLGAEFSVSDLSKYPDIPAAAENGKTFAENATAKAMAASKNVDCLVVADDSGLEVHALGGAPGIFSARYAGEGATDVQNVEKLLRELCAQSVPNFAARAFSLRARGRSPRKIDRHCRWHGRRKHRGRTARKRWFWLRPGICACRLRSHFRRDAGRN